ncbi:MAG: response regulator [candidate division Zixibacteria bacterium]|nr:response regulator [candidate division Zixibacteria bacterium]
MGRKVLVVDDSPTIIKFVAFSLKSNGFEVISAADGMDALEKLSHLEAGVDLVITDLNMPNVDGYELIATLRQNPRFRKLPIIILSSEESEQDKVKGRQAGADAYLVKPFKSTALLETIGKLLGNRTPQTSHTTR